MKISNLDRPILIDICADGTMSYRDKGDKKQKRLNGAALPVFSVDTVDEAKQLQVRFCRLQYTEHPKQPGRPWYVLTTFSGDLSDLDRVSAELATFYELSRKTYREEAKREARAMRDLHNTRRTREP